MTSGEGPLYRFIDGVGVASFYIQYLAESDSERPAVIGSFFTHGQSLEGAESAALQRSHEFPGVAAFRVMDMGGGEHLARTLLSRVV